MDKENGIVCYICGVRITSTLSSFRRHLKNKHNMIQSDTRNTVKCLEAFCDYSCLKIRDLRSHLEVKHEIVQEVEEFYFKNMQEFIRWKELMEIQSNLCYVKHYPTKNNISYYFCNRSGKKRIISSETRKRMLKSQGSCKIDSSCTSSIIVTERKEDLKVIYYKTHYGHNIQMAHVALHTSTKNIIASQLVQGIPATEILDRIRDSVDKEFQRIHLTSRKDIHNIAQAYSLYDKAIRHTNDAISVDIWVNEIMESDDNCVILYKKQGYCIENDTLKKDDFLLGIMTRPQIEIFKQFGNEGIICMDATHGTNPYDFKLVSVLVVDNFGEGFPVGFLVCTREDYTVLKYFLSRVKEKTGDIKANCFMSDDADQYFAAWSSVMNVENTKKLLCTWHVDRAWRKKINLIKNKEKQEQIYKTLCVVRQEPDILKFENYMKSFKALLETDPDLTEFHNYFKANYENKYMTWATCCRLGSLINTNMYLESMHKVLKYIYLNGKTCKRLDKTLHVLLKYIRDRQFQRLIKIDKGKVTTKISKINRSHMIAINSQDMFVVKNENNWIVKSNSTNYNILQVSPENHTCMLTCSLCNACAHIFSCTCMDFLIHSNMCKHIHKVCMEIRNRNSGETKTCDVNIMIENSKQETEHKEKIMHLSTLKKDSINLLASKITQNLNTLQAINWTEQLDENMLTRFNGQLTSMINYVTCLAPSTSFEVTQKKENPANKRIDTQLRFHSMKKKKKNVGKLAKPSLIESQKIKTVLEGGH